MLVAEIGWTELDLLAKTIITPPKIILDIKHLHGNIELKHSRTTLYKLMIVGLDILSIKFSVQHLFVLLCQSFVFRISAQLIYSNSTLRGHHKPSTQYFIIVTDNFAVNFLANIKLSIPINTYLVTGLTLAVLCSIMGKASAIS